MKIQFDIRSLEKVTGLGSYYPIMIYGNPLGDGYDIRWARRTFLGIARSLNAGAITITLGVNLIEAGTVQNFPDVIPHTYVGVTFFISFSVSRKNTTIAKLKRAVQLTRIEFRQARASLKHKGVLVSRGATS
jgi:hypothetical protein